MAFDSTSTLLATGGADATVKVWDVVRQYCTNNMRQHCGVVRWQFFPISLLGSAENSDLLALLDIANTHSSFITPRARYVPNVAKRSIWDQCKKKYILRTDRPATDRPTTSHLGNFQMAISPQGVVRSTSCLVLGWGFWVGGSNGAISSLTKSKMAARPPSWKIQMAISPWQIIRFTPCLVLGWGFRGRRIEQRYFELD